MKPKINPNRLLADLQHLRRFGAQGNGVVRPAFSRADLQSRQWLCAAFASAGLNANIDGVGNVFGRSRNPGPALLIGSHSDTQPQGGWLDGAYGVICALEIARTFSETLDTESLAIDVVSWMDEEGTFVSSLGSRSFCAGLDDTELNVARSADGQSLGAVMATTDFANNPAIRWFSSRELGYIEIHIEQGPVLDNAKETLAVVTGIVGVVDATVTFIGEQNHAGTTPMALRHDAAAALMAFAAQTNVQFPRHASDETVWTMGAIKLSTQARSTIPGKAQMSLQFRDIDPHILLRLEDVAVAIATEHNGRSGVEVGIHIDERLAPAQMDSNLQQHLKNAAQTNAPGRWRSMPSGAAHDAQVLAAVMPSAMLFVPSLKGVSHAFEEDTNQADLITGCQTLCDAALTILAEHRDKR